MLADGAGENVITLSVKIACGVSDGHACHQLTSQRGMGRNVNKREGGQAPSQLQTRVAGQVSMLRHCLVRSWSLGVILDSCGASGRS